MGEGYPDFTAQMVPVHPLLLPELRAMQHGSRPYFFGGRSANGRAIPKPVKDRRLLVYMQRIAKSLGIPTKRGNTGIVIHSFRDYFETCAVNSGIPQFVASMSLRLAETVVVAVRRIAEIKEHRRIPKARTQPACLAKA